MKPDCYKCKHREQLSYDAHSSCKHPAFEGGHNPILALLATLHASHRVGPIEAKSGEIKVTGNQHGIKMGWFMHPLNFDPVWLESCNGFEAKQSTAVSDAVSKAA
jgi:hypothetical protein